MSERERSATSDTGCAQVSNEELCALALAHYDHVSTVAHEWNNQVPQAIKAWYAAKAAASITPSATTRMSELVPTTWLDPLLTGPKAVVKSIPGNGNFTGTDIERLLKAIKERIQAAEPFQ